VFSGEPSPLTGGGSRYHGRGGQRYQPYFHGEVEKRASSHSRERDHSRNREHCSSAVYMHSFHMGESPLVHVLPELKHDYPSTMVSQLRKAPGITPLVDNSCSTHLHSVAPITLAIE